MPSSPIARSRELPELNATPAIRRGSTARWRSLRSRWAVVGLFGVYVAIFLLPLGARPVAMTDEARYAEIPREMLASGDLVVPHLDGLRYFEKPVLGYWLTALSMLAFGENPFAARFSSAAAAGLTALLIYWIVRRETGARSLALCSCLAYLTSVLVVLIGTISLLDTPFTLFATASIAFFLAAYRDRTSVPGILFPTLFGVSCAVAFLIKGFIAFAVPVVVIVPFMLWEGERKHLLRLAVWPLLVAAFAILPWVILVHRREGDFWHYFFWEEHIRRYLSARAQHRQAAWYFMPILFLGALPWTVVMPAVVLGLKRGTNHRSLVRFLTCWFVFPFLFFSASRGKLGTYILPCLPPLAVLTGIGLLSFLGGSRRRIFDVGSSILAAAAASGALLVAIGRVVPGMPMSLYGLHERPLWAVAVLGLLTCSFLAVVATRMRTPLRTFVTFALVPVPLFITIPFALPDVITSVRSADPFLAAHRDEVPASSILVADAERVEPVCWFFKRNDVSVLKTRGELEYGLGYPDAASRYLRVQGLRRLIDENRGRRPVTLVTSRARYEEYRAGLPDPVVTEIDPTVDGGRALLIARY